jgi:UDPglucose--hexose-1-phosphate uridylyltransferase
MTTTRPLRRTAIELADGRELIFFDEPGHGADRDRDVVDQRDLPELETASEIRYDALLDDWVVVASHRQTRTHLPPSDECPLCPSTVDRQTEIPVDDYDVVVFANRFPSFAETVADVVTGDVTGDVGGLFARRAGRGRCEVVCFTADHGTSFASLTPARVRTVVEAWADRTAALSQLPGVEQVFPFENRGQEIGVTLSHPHGQVYAYPFVTPVTRRMLDSARAHLAVTGRNLFDDVLAAEVAAGARIIRRTDHWTAFVPAAARWPFEVHLYPNSRVPDLTALDEEQRADFCDLYLEVLRRLDGLFGVQMPYIAAWHQAPVHVDRELAALHLRLFSTRRAPEKLKYLAGSESGMGVFINDIPPEHAAELLRAVVL